MERERRRVRRPLKLRDMTRSASICSLMSVSFLRSRTPRLPPEGDRDDGDETLCPMRRRSDDDGDERGLLLEVGEDPEPNRVVVGGKWCRLTGRFFVWFLSEPMARCSGTAESAEGDRLLRR